MRVIIRVTKRDTNDEEAIKIKKAVEAAVKQFQDATVEMNTFS